MTYRTIRYQIDDRVATITLSRPDRLNAMSRELVRELRQGVEDASADEGVGCVVLTGSGRAFSAGADLDDAPTTVEDIERSMLEIYNPMVDAIAQAQKPMIAMVNGMAVGAGASIALACDLRICSTEADFRFAFARVGLIPDCGATHFLPRLVGYGKAVELCLLGEPVGADEAVMLGLASKAVPPAQLAAQTRRIAQGLAGGATSAYVRTRKALRDGMGSDLETALRREATMQLDLATAPEFSNVAATVRGKSPRPRPSD